MIAPPFRKLLIGIFLLSVGLTACKPAAPPAAEVEAALGEYAPIYGAGVRVRVPEGFEEATFSGFGNPQTRCILFAKSSPIAFQEDFDKHSKSLQQMKILERKKVQIDGLRGILLHVESPKRQGETRIQRRWDCMFGDERVSILISGYYYSDQPPVVSAAIREAILTAKRDDSPAPKVGDRQSFVLQPSAKLKLIEEIWRHYTYTEDGKEQATVTAPILSAGNFRHLKPADFDEREFAEEQLRNERGVEQIKIRSCEPITLDELSGFELEATCVHTKSQQQVVLYYVVVFEPAECIMISGFCGADVADGYLPEFKAMARSLKRKVVTKD